MATEYDWGVYLLNGVNEHDTAHRYAFTIWQSDMQVSEGFWKRVNTALLNKYGMAGLKRVKKEAWQILERGDANERN